MQVRTRCIFSHRAVSVSTCHPETPKQQQISLKTSLLQLICPKQTHQNHMPSRGTQTATHQLDTFANQFPNASATETTCHPETPEQEALSDRNRTLNGKGARQVHNWMATAATVLMDFTSARFHSIGESWPAVLVRGPTFGAASQKQPAPPARTRVRRRVPTSISRPQHDTGRPFSA